MRAIRWSAVWVATLLYAPLVVAQPWDEFRAEFIEKWFELNPVTAVAAGRHDFDGRLPDLSPAGLSAYADFFRRTRERAAAYRAQGASTADAYERDLLLWFCDRQLFWLERARWPQVNPEYYGGVFSPSAYVSRAYAALDVRMVAFTRWATAVPRALDQMRANLVAPLPKVYIERTIARFDGLASYLASDVPAIFDGAGTDAQRTAFDTANQRAIAAFEDAAAWLRAELPRGTDAYAMGRPLFDELLARSEALDLNTEQLADWNERDLTRNTQALRAACSRFAPGLSLTDCVARVDLDKPADGPVAAAAAQLDALEQFVRDRHVVAVPLPDRATVAEAPPYNRANSAYIERPGPYEPDGLPAVYYIAPPDPSWTIEEQHAYIPGISSLMFTSIHEVWPGHFLQGLHAKAFAPPLAQLVRATTFTEGWAHYSEELMWEVGFGAGDDRMHIAQITNALLRNVRVKSAVGLHTRGMTLAESERAFREEAFVDTGNARQQAARGTYDPDYFAYTLGKLQIRALRDEWASKHGGEGSWKAFHDALLALGAPPLSLARRYIDSP